MAQNIRKNKDSFFDLYFTSTLSIVVVLIMIGIASYFFFVANYFTKELKESVVISLVLNNDINNAEQKRIENYLNNATYIKQSVYISKEEALKDIVNYIGEDPSDLLGFNPMFNAYEINVHAEYAHVDSIKPIAEKLKAFRGVKDVNYQQEIIGSVNNNINIITLILSFIAILMTFISMVLINNTVRMTIYSKRFLINTMKLVGAEWSFIRRPFMKKGFINGLVAAVIANVLLLSVGFYFKATVVEFNIMPLNIVLLTVAIVSIMGILISTLATLFSVNKFLKMKTDELYYI